MIEIKDLCKKYGDKILFEGFSLNIPDNSFAVISGNSGCGKTTLLNMIGGLERPDEGCVTVDGLQWMDNFRTRKIFYRDIVGFLFQNFALLENKTVRKNLSMIKKSGRTEISVKEALDRVGLAKEENKKVYKLSGGEQQRVALARLMIKKCNLILADEPTGSLDRDNSKMVMEILHSLHKMGKTVIIVTHDQNIVDKETFVIKL